MDILCETSVRHVHLTQADVELLFGKGADLEFDRALSQPDQFLSKQRVTLIGPKRELANVAVLGPVRAGSQAEITMTDAFTLGLKDVPVRLSGDTKNAPDITVRGTCGEVYCAAIIAKRHLHLDPKTAQEGGFTDREIVLLEFKGERAAVLDGVVVRVDKNFAPAVHLDSDEANGVLAGKTVKVLKK
jgi:putative phosphotransacetylase